MATSLYCNIYRYACPNCQTRFKTSRAPNYEPGEKIENSWCPECSKMVSLTLENYVGAEDKVIPILQNTDQVTLYNRLRSDELMTQERWNELYSLLLKDLKEEIMKELKGETQ